MEMKQCSGQEINFKENLMHKVMDELKETTQIILNETQQHRKKADQYSNRDKCVVI